jgi:hypothetical protein
VGKLVGNLHVCVIGAGCVICPAQSENGVLGTGIGVWGGGSGLRGHTCVDFSLGYLVVLGRREYMVERGNYGTF